MSYHKMTCISGRDSAGAYKNAVFSGHWNPNSAARVATRMKIVGPIGVTHSTGDLSGKGRGGCDRKFTVENDVAVPVPLSAYERGYDDADDVNDAWDDLESRA